MMRFEDVNESNWRLGLSVKAEQARFVSDPNRIYARAYAYRNARSRAFVIYDGETAVGTGLYYDEPSIDAYDLSQLLIDQRFQGRGYGKAATQMILDEMSKDGRYKKVVLCYVEGNDAAKRMYEQFGFVETGRDEDEIIMELAL